MKFTFLALLCTLAAIFAQARAQAFELPAEGDCPPQKVEPGGDALPLDEDVVPSRLVPGKKLDLPDLRYVRDYLPPEVWERRTTFFYEGMRMEIGPCYRRYPVPPWFEEQTLANASTVRLDEEGNLIGYAGEGMPFPVDSIADDAPDAGQRWAWNYRYRYQGAGFRGPFRILDVARRGKKVERYEGNFFLMPLQGVPGVKIEETSKRFVAGGEFKKPFISRGLAWRQFRRTEADQEYENSDEVFVWVPTQRKVRRAPPQNTEGIYMPSYTRANTIDSSRMTMPDGTNFGDTGNMAAEPTRRGFVGLMIRPNAYRFKLARVQDVLAPINSITDGYPTQAERSYGPSGLSVATDRWELRRALVLQGDRKQPEGNVAALTLYVDAQTLAPLYMVSKRRNRSIYEVGIFVGRYGPEDPLTIEWAGSKPGFGVIVPVAQTFLVSGGESWVRESYELHTEPPTPKQIRQYQSTRRLSSRGR